MYQYTLSYRNHTSHSLFSPIPDTPSASPTPLAAPVLSSSTGKLFTVDLTEALPGQHAGSSDAADRQLEPAQNVSYLFRVQQGSNTTYLWQVHLPCLCTILVVLYGE